MWAKPGPWDNVVDFFIALGSLPLARLADEYRIRETEGREPVGMPGDVAYPDVEGVEVPMPGGGIVMVFPGKSDADR